MINLEEEMKALNDKCFEKKLELVTKVINSQKDELLGQLKYFIKKTLTNKSFPLHLNKNEVKIEKIDVDYGCLNDSVIDTDIDEAGTTYLYAHCSLRGVDVTIGVFIRVSIDMDLKQGDWQVSCPNNDLDGCFTQGNFTQDTLNIIEKEVQELGL